MKRVTAFVGSAHRKNTHRAVVQFLDSLQSLGGVECEIVTLSDYTLQPCRGCEACIARGEEFCPLRDDRDVLMAKIVASDGVVFASPNYCAQVSGIMKVFLDRFAFICHRPRYFGKAFTSIVTQKIGGGKQIVEYLGTLAMTLGFDVVPGTCIASVEVTTAKEQQKVDSALTAQARQFHAMLAKPPYPVPTLLRLMFFRMWRNIIPMSFPHDSRDYQYYAEKGWFTADYYYPTRLNLFQRVAGKFFDWMAERQAGPSARQAGRAARQSAASAGKIVA